MRCAGRFHQRIIKLSHGIGEQFFGVRAPDARFAWRSTDHCADNVSDGLGVEPALLQNLARQPFNPLSDRFVFGDGRHGVRRSGRLGHVKLHGW